MKTGVEGENDSNGRGLGEDHSLESKVDFEALETGLENGSSEKVVAPRQLMVDWRGRPIDTKKTGTWKAAWILCALSIANTIGLMSISINLVDYFTTELHQSVAKASSYLNHFAGTAYILTLFWGFVADSYLGNYWTIALSAMIYIAGLATLTFVASDDSLQTPDCVATLTSACPPAGDRIMARVITALYVVAAGCSGMFPTAGAMGADQFDENEPSERAQGVHYFVWYFFCLQIGLLLSYSLLVYIQTSISFGLGYGVCLAIVVVAVVVFFMGTTKYRHAVPTGSPFTRMAQVLVAAARKWNVPVPEDKSLLHETKSKFSSIKGTRKLEHSPIFTTLDKAAVIKDGEDGKAENSWKLCTVTQVEELKRIVGILPIWLTTCFVYISYAQLSSFMVAQGLTMDRHMGPNFQIPAVSIAVFMVVLTMILIPLYDRYFVPLARRITGNELGISPLQRMGTGMFLVCMSYLVAAAIEGKRLDAIRDGGFQNSPVGTFVLPTKVYWLLPVYLLLAPVEVFTTIGQLQFFYNESTDGTRSLGTSFFFAALSMGYFMASVIQDAVESTTGDNPQGGWLTGRFNNGGLKNYYYLLAVIMAVDFVAFLIFTHFYRYKKVLGAESPTRHF